MKITMKTRPLLATLLALLVSAAPAADVVIAFDDPNGAEVGVTSYHWYLLNPGGDPTDPADWTKILQVPEHEAVDAVPAPQRVTGEERRTTLTLADGQSHTVAVAAFNGYNSGLSSSLIVPDGPPIRVRNLRMVLTLEVGP